MPAHPHLDFAPEKHGGERDGSAPQGEPLQRGFAVLLVLLVAGYLLFDRAFAWLHIPKTPLFISEIVLLVGVAWTLTTSLPGRSLMRRSAPIGLLLAFIVWGAVLTVPGLWSFGLDAVRDAAIWYYSLFALMVIMLLSSKRARLRTALDLYERFIPLLVTWLVIAAVLTDLPVVLTVPDSAVSVFSHSHSLIAVQAVTALTFIWIARPDHMIRRPGWHAYVTSVALAAAILSGTQARSGLVAAVLGITLAVVLAQRQRGQMLVFLVVSATAVVVIGSAFAAGGPEFVDRSVTADQLRENVYSIFDPDNADAQLAATAAWRQRFWSEVIDDVVHERLIAGYGFGTNIREVYGYQKETPPSRNAHSSHVTIFARMGAPGIILWLATWAAWFWNLMASRRKLLLSGHVESAGILSWLVVTASMVLLNAYFTSTLEGPQTAIWLWVIFGTGAFLAYRYRRSFRRVL